MLTTISEFNPSIPHSDTMRFWPTTCCHTWQNCKHKKIFCRGFLCLKLRTASMPVKLSALGNDENPVLNDNLRETMGKTTHPSFHYSDVFNRYAHRFNPLTQSARLQLRNYLPIALVHKTDGIPTLYRVEQTRFCLNRLAWVHREDWLMSARIANDPAQAQISTLALSLKEPRYLSCPPVSNKTLLLMRKLLSVVYWRCVIKSILRLSPYATYFLLFYWRCLFTEGVNYFLLFSLNVLRSFRGLGVFGRKELPHGLPARLGRIPTFFEKKFNMLQKFEFKNPNFKLKKDVNCFFIFRFVIFWSWRYSGTREPWTTSRGRSHASSQTLLSTWPFVKKLWIILLYLIRCQLIFSKYLYYVFWVFAQKRFCFWQIDLKIVCGILILGNFNFIFVSCLL